MNVWDSALKKESFQHTRATRRWSSATSGVQNVLLVHRHTTVDVDATVWWPGRWSLGQTTATLQSERSDDRRHECGIAFMRRLERARNRCLLNVSSRVAVVWPRYHRPGHQTVASTSRVVWPSTRRTFWTPDLAELHLRVALVCWKLPFSVLHLKRS